MKVTIIGSTQYLDRMISYRDKLAKEGHKVRIPAFDDNPQLNELGICKHNRALIEWADRVDIFWDQRSMGTIFDFGMAFALSKPIKIIYLEPKTFANVMRQYEAQGLASVSK